MSAIIQSKPLGPPPWPTLDPFLFCVHHDDAYPRGNAEFGPDASLEGRQMGMDFAGKDGWRMYHGQVVPGFPQHPHRGFETITLARQGFIDHSDSLGAKARFGRGDVQWMTAGAGIVHSELFPLLHQDRDNPAELFQIWLNLPRAKKMVDPYFTMLWSETIPTAQVEDASGKTTELTFIAGAPEDTSAPPPPPDSWASQPDSHLAIWTLSIPDEGSYTLAPAGVDVTRALYVVRGAIRADDKSFEAPHILALDPHEPLPMVGQGGAELLLLQGRPIGEPVVQHGPFVMNEPAEIRQAIMDYQRTRFGGWPFDRDDPVHGRDTGRFAKHADGREEQPPQ